MKISQLIKQLEQIKGEVGDLEVMVRNNDEYGAYWYHASSIEKLSMDENGYFSNYSVNRPLACIAIGLVD